MAREGAAFFADYAKPFQDNATKFFEVEQYCFCFCGRGKDFGFINRDRIRIPGGLSGWASATDCVRFF